ncbi:MAG: DUF2330 domain-containing protein [Nitrospiria bacterium]
MKKISLFSFILITTFLVSTAVFAFCGFYVAKADTKIFNKASQVVIARHDDKTVITMSNDFKGDLKEFAMVIPVPTVLKKGQIHVGDRRIIDHLDVYSSPRLVEYFDQNPCLKERFEELRSDVRSKADMPSSVFKSQKKQEVTIEARYTVGEYDILILSADESNGLEHWLVRNGYKVPEGAASVLEAYIKQGMKFFVAKVNLKEQARLGFATLRPLQVAFSSLKFMLPIRLGMVNADGPQELFIYTLTKNGRVETTNYRTAQLPSNVALPTFVKSEFGDFYKDLFSQQVKKERMETLFLEYAWNMAWCDPCATDPLSHDELRKLGVFWLDHPRNKGRFRGMLPKKRITTPPQVYLTRLHVRYDAAHFPEDLRFQETGNQQNFQARYILRHPWDGDANCASAASYRKNLSERQEKEAQHLANLTGWDIETIREKIGIDAAIQEKPWYEKLWG